AEQEEAQHGGGEEQAGEDQQVGGLGEVGAGGVELQPPGDVRVGEADAEEVQGGLPGDDVADVEHRQHHDGSDRVGQDVLDHDPQVARAQHAGGGDVVHLPYRDDLGTHQARHGGPAEHDQD